MGCKGITIMGDEPGAVHAEGMGHEDPGFQASFATVQAEGLLQAGSGGAEGVGYPSFPIRGRVPRGGG